MMETKQKILLEMKKVSIEFPGVKALDNVDFSTITGTSHALIGANGSWEIYTYESIVRCI